MKHLTHPARIASALERIAAALERLTAEATGHEPGCTCEECFAPIHERVRQQRRAPGAD